MQKTARTITSCQAADRVQRPWQLCSGAGHPDVASRAKTHGSANGVLALGLVLGMLTLGRTAIGQEQSSPAPDRIGPVWDWRHHEPTQDVTHLREKVDGVAPHRQDERREAQAVDQLYRELTGQSPAAPRQAGALSTPAAGRLQDAAATPRPAPPGIPLTTAQVEIVLHGHGYSDLDGLEREGDSFHVRSARRYGELVGELQVDAVTGRVRGERMNEAQARAMLLERGFSEVPEVRREGDMIFARGRRNGSEIDVSIDAPTGAVIRQALVALE